MCHLQARPLKSTFNIEPFVRLAAVEDALVAAYFDGDIVEGLDDFEPEFFALLVLCDGDVFNMAN